MNNDTTDIIAVFATATANDRNAVTNLTVTVKTLSDEIATSNAKFLGMLVENTTLLKKSQNRLVKYHHFSLGDEM